MDTMDNKNIEFILTTHANKVVVEREIKHEWIQRILTNPMKIEVDENDLEVFHALGQIPENDNRVLRVVFTKNGNMFKIITTYFDRTMRNRL
jgi:hypothetical protein